jgi:thiamine biosynthesis lipoprotein
MKFTKQFITLTLIFMFLGCEKVEMPKKYSLAGLVFGTSYKINYLNATENYQKSIDSLFFLVNKSMSTYMPSSDISKINKGDSTLVVDDFFLEVFEKSKRIYKETAGFFDPTVGNLVNAWGFGPKDQRKNLTIDEVANQMRFVGLDKVKISHGKVIKENIEIYLDFNSIAKGYGLDLIARFLDKKNISNYLIEIGGEIRAKGKKQNDQPWIIKLVNPIKTNADAGFKILNLSNRSMATSGNYRKFRITEDGKRYVHIINPKTGFATESNLLSVSVIAQKDCADLDAYATAFMTMGLEKTKTFLTNYQGLQVVLISVNEDGFLEEFSTYKE